VASRHGAAAINNLMEDAATAEISRSQVWQWIHHGVSLAEGPRVTAGLVRDIEREEMAKIKSAVARTSSGRAATTKRARSSTA